MSKEREVDETMEDSNSSGISSPVLEEPLSNVIPGPILMICIRVLVFKYAMGPSEKIYYTSLKRGVLRSLATLQRMPSLKCDSTTGRS